MVRSFDRHTLLDLTVNFVPVVIMGLFVALFLVFAPWGRLGLASLIQFGLIVVMAVLLVSVSTKAGLAVSRSEGGEP